ncbi:hypothetical protein MMC25_002984 [Agyrium rufum]|nr:hypothetical protein [Agyrium rufum]
MLSPAAARRVSSRKSPKSTPTKPKPSPIAKSSGATSAGVVQDRVRQWQAQGGGVISASDIYVEDEDEEGESPIVIAAEPRKASTKSPVKGTPSKSPAVRSGKSQPRESRSRTNLEVEENWDDRTRSVSAPRKRVVSDEHWRKKRSPPKQSKTQTPSREQVPTKTQKYEHDITVEYEQDSERERRKSKSRERVTPKKSPSGADDGIRVYATPPTSRRSSRQAVGQGEDRLFIPVAEPEGKEDASISPYSESKADHLGRRISTSSQDDSLVLSASTAQPLSKGKMTSQRKGRSSDISPQTTKKGGSTRRLSARSQRSNLLGQVFGESRKIFSKPEPTLIVNPRVPSVEAWLNDTPDPFMEEIQNSSDVPPPLNPSVKRGGSSHSIADDFVGEWDSVSKQEWTPSTGDSVGRSRRLRSSPQPSAEHEVETVEPDLYTPDFKEKSNADAAFDHSAQSDVLSPANLRRRGARRNASSPKRDRGPSSPLKESHSINDENAPPEPPIKASKHTHECPEPLAPLRPPGLNIRRPAPTMGAHRLSTIASIETFSTRKSSTRSKRATSSEYSDMTYKPRKHEDENQEYEARDRFDEDGLERRISRNKIAKHDDLMSVLSLPQAGSKSIRSARSIRTSRSRLATATIPDLMKELADDEDKYMRELRTLVDGVVPVLLTCALSADHSTAAGLFNASARGKKDAQMTQSIMDMGVALERLKVLHKRIPRQDPDSFLSWAHGAHKVYAEFLKAWRMGFQDVVVNLVSADNTQSDHHTTNPGEDDNGLPRNEEGDVIDNNGERVDVAFLLRRPLVRIKYLAKSLKGINFIRSTTESEALAAKYYELVTLARHRSAEERARMEDEAAASIDPTRARDIRTLGPLAGVTLDNARRVRARDYFNLDLKHSTGQRVDCRVELLMRDDPPDRGSSGDLLLCEVDNSDRWLLFPPVQYGNISARNGDRCGEIVVMLRGIQSQGQEWHELLVLRTDDEQTGLEWVQMLGLEPIPPRVTRTQSFMKKQERRKTMSASMSASSLDIIPERLQLGKSRTPSPREIEIPIGERARGATPPATAIEKVPDVVKPATSSPARERNRLSKIFKGLPSLPHSEPSSPQLSRNDLSPLPSQEREERPRSVDAQGSSRTLAEKLGLVGSSSPQGLRRSKAKRVSRYMEDEPLSPPLSRNQTDEDLRSRGLEDTFRSPNSQPNTPTTPRSVSPEQQGHKLRDAASTGSPRPRYGRSRSSVPALDMPVIPKIRKDGLPSIPTHEVEEEPSWGQPGVEAVRLESPQKLSKPQPTSSPIVLEKPPPPPPHRSSSSTPPNGSTTPDLSPKAARQAKRRSSSPLKREYAPSTSSESTSDSDASTVERKGSSSISDSSSSDEEPEEDDIPTPLVPLAALNRLQKKYSPPATIYSESKDTISPSQSASQAPYKQVPLQPTKTVRAIASIFYWSDSGSWQPLHPDECSINITPGLIEAFEMSPAHCEFQNCADTQDSPLPSSGSAEPPTRPLVALELTPLVPIRRGTALDISIRSPPTPASLHTSSQNTLFRSRNPEECEALYGLINHARINNPTYIALQNARLTTSYAPSFAVTGDRGSKRHSWFGLGRKTSYRASSAPTPSIAITDSSNSSMQSAFSALRSFGRGAPSGGSSGGKGLFNISRSTVTTSQMGSRAGSIYTSSGDSSGSGSSTPLPPGISAMGGSAGRPGAKFGLENLAIRLYIRDTSSKWRDLGQATLNILRPVPSNTAGLTPTTNLAPPTKPNGTEKRILITSMKKPEKNKEPVILLDVTLGETGFERVARTGIALSYWEELIDGRVAKEGGVVPGRARIPSLA